jgi:hypothetical protein
VEFRLPTVKSMSISVQHIFRSTRHFLALIRPLPIIGGVIPAVLLSAHLTGADHQTEYVVPIVVVKYFPVNGDLIDIRVTGDWGKSLAVTRTKTDSLTRALVDSLREASRYHRYRNSSAEPGIRYLVVKTYEFLEPLPTWDKPGHSVPMTDYAAIINRIDGRRWVEEDSIKEFWVWGYHGGKVDLWESDMAGPFGDVSNSDRDPEDLPLFEHTYTVYHYNYQRGLSETMEDHVHQIEALLNFVDGRDTTPEDQWGRLLFWGKFVGYFPGGNWANAAPGISRDRRCGWAHFTPNSERDYDWANHTLVESDIEDWKPDGTGKRRRITCERWGCSSVGWFMLWLQSLPGRENGLTMDGKNLTNWWKFVGDFDAAMRAHATLLEK